MRYGAHEVRNRRHLSRVKTITLSKKQRRVVDAAYCQTSQEYQRLLRPCLYSISKPVCRISAETHATVLERKTDTEISRNLLGLDKGRPRPWPPCYTTANHPHNFVHKSSTLGVDMYEGTPNVACEE